MTRVSENSGGHSLQFALNRAKAKMEKLRLKGATLKEITRPSDNPLSNVEALQLGSELSDNKQYVRNSNYATMLLNVTEKSLEQLSEIVLKAKEIAISQASDFYDINIRKNIANEVHQLRNQALSIGNKRIGNKYIFAGFSSMNTPFNKDGVYAGDVGHVKLEVGKDFFVQTNLHGKEVFFSESAPLTRNSNPLHEIQKTKEGDTPWASARATASNEKKDAQGFSTRSNLFAQLESLAVSLENNDPDTIQNLIEEFDSTLSRLITMRTRVGSIVSTIEQTKNNLESENISKAERRSYLVDADVADLFADITKQQELLKTTYQSSKGMINQNLMDFIH